jgi:hypothetical protein
MPSASPCSRVRSADEVLFFCIVLCGMMGGEKGTGYGYRDGRLAGSLDHC